MSSTAEPPSPQRRAPLTRPQAWTCALVNQLAFPGLGTIMAGRRIGYLQAAMMLGGFLLAMVYMIAYFLSVARFVAHANLQDLDAVALHRSYLGVGVTGFALCAVAWGWALVSSLRILKVASQPPPLPFPIT